MTLPVDPIIEKVQDAFRRVPFPGDAFLQGSLDGCEPYEEAGHFKGKTDWTALEAAFLDERYCAPSFLSEGAFRFFIPAWIVADLRRALRTADPSFHLTSGFADQRHAPGEQTTWEWGGSVLLNPRRYGAMRWIDHARYRLSVFAREEASAIVDYLRWRQELAIGEDPDEATTIGVALDRFWVERARSAPTQDDLEARVQRELAALEAHRRSQDQKG